MKTKANESLPTTDTITDDEIELWKYVAIQMWAGIESVEVVE